MSVDPQTTAILRFLKKEAPEYWGRAKDLREAVEGWLGYIPATFGHYTRHTVQHSDEMIGEMSMLLFENGNPKKPVVDLSPVEAYILVAAAYLHDAGMVVSDREKAEILQSEEWKRWTSEGAGVKRWQEVQEFRESGSAPSDEVRRFLADVQTRFLIAEFVRRSHHRRAADFLEQHEAALGRFAFEDPVLRRTIADVCKAHGLATYELDDRQRFPDRRSVRHGLANVQFLAIVLRLGDLLDMSYDRACPLLLNAASPLPPDSYAHWSQYARVVDRLTAHDLIRVRAECETQEEHRYLRDWCQWLVAEVRSAASLMSHAERHQDWRPPRASFKDEDHPDGTIDIQPSARANYVFTDWRFELDSDAVFERLIRDVHGEPMEFIRELLQNAFDASRCQMYADLRREGETPPKYPTQVDEDRRRRYPIKVSLEVREIEIELSGESEERQVLTIEDLGIGMDKHIIERYFLQVGRSYYQTDEFRTQYRFVPASRFGVGFLSTFAASNDVVVETYKPSSPRNDGPLRLRLRGPRNYLLTERARRALGGTRIEVTLRSPIEAGMLTKLVSDWCKRVEFPIVVDELGVRTTIEADKPLSDVSQVPDVSEEDACFTIRTFPIDSPGMEGEAYVFAHVDSRGESWVATSWAHYTYLNKYPLASLPRLPSGYVCLHGINTGAAIAYSHIYDIAGTLRLDVRREMTDLPMSRDLPRSPLRASSGLRACEQHLWEKLLADHLAESRRASGTEAWKYKQQLIDVFPAEAYWRELPGTIRLYENGESRCVSLREVLDMPVVLLVLKAPRPRAYGVAAPREEAGPPLEGLAHPAITHSDVRALSDEHFKAIWGARGISSLTWVSPEYFALEWVKSQEPSPSWMPSLLHASPTQFARVVPIPDETAFGTRVLEYDIDKIVVLVNSTHPFFAWLNRVCEACERGTSALTRTQFHRLLDALRDAVNHGNCEHLSTFLEVWAGRDDLPPELRAPAVPDIETAFRLMQPEDMKPPA